MPLPIFIVKSKKHAFYRFFVALGAGDARTLAFQVKINTEKKRVMSEIDIDLIILIIFFAAFSVFTLFRLNNLKIKGMFSKKNMLIFMLIIIFSTIWVFVDEHYF